MIDNRPLIQNAQLLPQDVEYAGNVRTDWIDRSFCCCRVAYFPVGKFSICEHWRVSLKIPSLVLLLLTSSFVLFILDTAPILKSAHQFPNKYWNYGVYSALSVTFLFVIISYFSIIIYGPGYLPYNWCITRQDEYDWETMMSSIAVYQEQVEFGKTHERPARASFSVDARRYVLRADHFCYWTQSWIGLKNHRFFLLLTGWASLYCLELIGFKYFWIKDIITTSIKQKKFDFLSIPGFIFLLFAIILFVFAFRLFIVAMNNLAHNLTLIERWKKKESPTPGRSACKNFESVCGSKSCCICWFLPFISLKQMPESSFDDDGRSVCSESLLTQNQ